MESSTRSCTGDGGTIEAMSDQSRVLCAADAIDSRLTEIARDVIRRHLDLSLPETRAFLAAPDGREQHQTMWHQWGIITHTRVFLTHFENDVPAYLREWGLWNEVNTDLSRPIDGTPRWDLLRVTILLHDIGKFAARTRGRQRFHFTNHEQMSGTIIVNELDLAQYGLTQRQIAYVARTAADHFVLGVIRKRARELGRYDETYIAGPEFRAISDEIRGEHPDDYVEIGVLFLGDSLAKVDPLLGPQPAVDQYEVNIVAAHEYLRRVLE